MNDAATQLLATQTRVLPSYVQGAWWQPSSGTPTRDASTGEVLALVGSAGIDLVGAVEYGRTIGTMTYASIVCRDTEAEAQRDYQRLVDGIDWDSIDYLTKVFGLEGQSYGDAEMVRQLRTQFALGWGGMTFVGTPEQITEKLLKTSEAGLDGIVIGFHDYLPEMKHFDETVMPLLKQAGLRH